MRLLTVSTHPSISKESSPFLPHKRLLAGAELGESGVWGRRTASLDGTSSNAGEEQQSCADEGEESRLHCDGRLVDADRGEDCRGSRSLFIREQAWPEGPEAGIYPHGFVLCEHGEGKRALHGGDEDAWASEGNWRICRTQEELLPIDCPRAQGLQQRLWLSSTPVAATTLARSPQSQVLQQRLRAPALRRLDPPPAALSRQDVSFAQRLPRHRAASMLHGSFQHQNFDNASLVPGSIDRPALS